MGRVSKKKIDPQLLKELDTQFNSLISSLTNKEDIEVFIKEFLTKEEKIMLSKRLLLYMMLIKGFASEEIESALLMSRETIRWYTEIFNSKEERFRKQIEKQIQKSELQKLWGYVGEAITTIMKSKTNMKARMKLLGPF